MDVGFQMSQTCYTKQIYDADQSILEGHCTKKEQNLDMKIYGGWVYWKFFNPQNTAIVMIYRAK